MVDRAAGLSFDDFAARVKSYQAYRMTDDALDRYGFPPQLNKELKSIRDPDGMVRPTDQNVQRLWGVFCGLARGAGAVKQPAHGPQLDPPQGRQGVQLRVDLDARTSRVYETFVRALKETD